MLAGVFEEFSTWSVPQPFPRIPFSEALMKYGTDKPDLRIPIEICDVSDLLRIVSLQFLQRLWLTVG